MTFSPYEHDSLVKLIDLCVVDDINDAYYCQSDIAHRHIICKGCSDATIFFIYRYLFMNESFPIQYYYYDKDSQKTNTWCAVPHYYWQQNVWHPCRPTIPDLKMSKNLKTILIALGTVTEP